jgi:lipoyl(octanoyl) transferase
MQNRIVRFEDLKLVDYKNAWEYQTSLFEGIIATKTQNRATKSNQETENYLVFCEHPHVYTMGKTGKKEHLLLPVDDLPSKNASYYEINRGGDITYHGPGQLVAYPILDLDHFFTDIHKYMRCLEEVVIKTCEALGISAGRVNGLTGVWVGSEEANYRKICAMGVKTSRWVTMHGLAFNVNTELSYFSNIVPCGIDDKEVTSVEKELGGKQDMEKIKNILKECFQQVFDCKVVDAYEKRH